MDKKPELQDLKQNQAESQETAAKAAPAAEIAREIGGRKGPEPTRFGDWELNGKCVDF